MTCKAYQTIVNHYKEGILDQEALDDLQQHIKTCSACGAVVSEFSQMQMILEDSLHSSNTGKEKISQAITEIEIHPRTQAPFRKLLIPLARYGTAAAVFLVLGLFWGSRKAPDASSQQQALGIVVSKLQGNVLVKHPWENHWQKMSPGESIYEGDTFLSLHEAALVLSLDPNNAVTLNENSSLALLEYNGRTEFEITYGTVKATLDGPHEPFFVSTPQGRFEALGTEFIVRVR
ncbi:FecR domain-containing protein [Planctomycetota bacterium]